MDLSDRLNNIESNLSLLTIIHTKAFKDGTIKTDEDELKAVRNDIFITIEDLKQRIFTIKRQLKSLNNIINTAKRV